MATPPSDDTKTLFRLLENEEWHPYLEIRDRLAATVPPGRSLRKYNERLESSRRFRNDQRAETTLTESERIFYGARACAQVTISSWKGRGVQQRTENGVKQIRKRPGFQVWGIGSTAGEAEKGEEAARPDAEAPEKAGGYTEVPPEDSEPSTTLTESAEGASVEEALPSKVVEEPIKPEDSWEVKASNAFALAQPLLPTVTNSAWRACPECGIGVGDQELHDQWHAAQNTDPEVQLLDKVTLHTLVGVVMRQVLDEFQDNMQGWLEEQFAQLSDQIASTRRPGQRWAQGDRGSTRL